MKISSGRTADPRLLQHIAFTAVVLFALLMSYMIHITQKTVASVQAQQSSIDSVITGTQNTPSAATTPESDDS